MSAKIPYKLRPWDIADLPSIMICANNAKIASNLTNRFPHPYTEEAGRGFINMAMDQKPTAIMCIEIDGLANGGIGIHVQQDVMCKNAEMGYWLAEPYWGNGIITDAVVKMIEYGFSTFDITRIYARPYGKNIASQKVLEKAGFKLEGRFEKTIYKNGEFLDELIYAVRK